MVETPSIGYDLLLTDTATLQQNTISSSMLKENNLNFFSLQKSHILRNNEGYFYFRTIKINFCVAHLHICTADHVGLKGLVIIPGCT